ncbi:MFS transporter [Mitsuaria sp. BK037]|uniref:MFS transporter n=1 Tax=Mitsuaria sp. BK037 TaxID=2587122 RepID=UPI00160D5739|nr:MFS transporter [Mitsuaria sp. BK037]MBB3283614.1 PAT family beta-lactamase induction signal transducer AmpG [Mitsuaria sp. BK037]
MSASTVSPVSASIRSPWAWVPTLYFAQALPYVFVMSMSTVMYKNFGISNTDMALFTSGLYLPWVVKPLWSPLVEMFATKRLWTVATQFLIAAALTAVALALPLPAFFQLSLAALWVMAFVSASHDIAADGLYLLSLAQHQQAAFVGVRSTFYRLANIACMGGLVVLAGEVQKTYGSWVLAWQTVIALMAGGFLLLAGYHWWRLPRPAADAPMPRSERSSATFVHIFTEFFRKPGLAVILGFLLLYRFPEAQLLKLAVPFLLDPQDQGGLGLSNTELGIVYGTVGLIALTVGGLLGGWAISRVGLKRALWPMVLAMHLPNVVFLAMAWSHPGSLWIVAAALAVEQFGYGLGFTAYMMFMVLVADGPHKTAHYSICTGFMALGMMLPGMWSGWLQDQLGYLHFFGWVLLATIPSLVMTALIRIPEGFGRKEPGA